MSWFSKTVSKVGKALDPTSSSSITRKAVAQLDPTNKNTFTGIVSAPVIMPIQKTNEILAKVDPTSNKNAVGRVLSPIVRPAVGSSLAMFTGGASTLIAEKTGWKKSTLGKASTVQGFVDSAKGVAAYYGYGAPLKGMIAGAVGRAANEINGGSNSPTDRAPVAIPGNEGPATVLDGGAPQFTPGPAYGYGYGGGSGGPGLLQRLMDFAFPR